MSFEAEAAELRQRMQHLQLNNDQLLTLYALFKQGSLGDAPARLTASTILQGAREIAKHQAWADLRGVPREEAQQTYRYVVSEYMRA